MKEELLHFIWQSKLLLGKNLYTTSGETITIENLGTHNLNSGPDFFNAKLKIGDTLWAGNIEIHVRSVDWNNHKHQTDDAYNNVILHVVYVHDKEVARANGEPLPTLELREFIPASLLHKYKILQEQQFKHIACERILVMPDESILSNWLQRLLIERIEQKCDHIKELLVKTHHHYEKSFYIITARYFGMKTNAQPFEQLAKQLPVTVIAKHKNKFEEVLALVLGVSGLLRSMGEEYKSLIPIFEHLQRKYNLNVMDESIWKFARTRPANFPSVRLVQFAALLFQSSHLLSKVLECETVAELEKLYAAPTFWRDQKIALGKSAIELLLLNSVLPFVFLYGKLQHREDLCDKALLWYEQLPAEKNAIVRQYESLGLQAKNAADTQAYIQLKNEYCIPLKCLQCSLGYRSLLYV
jgi:hypothetical protein